MDEFLIKALQLILAFSILVTIHEFGHYIFARIFGIRVDKFFLFFNPRFSLVRYIPKEGRLELCTWMDKKEEPHPLATFKVGKSYKEDEKIPAWKQTIYGIGWLPLGGYCAISGMIDETQGADKLSAEPQSWEFRTKPAWQRLLVMCGGVLFNFLLAIIIYIGLAFSYGEQCVKFRDAYEGMDYVAAAQAVGFRNGDIPLMADGKEVEATDPDALLSLAQAREVKVFRNGKDTVSIQLPKDFIMDLNDDRGFFEYRLPVVVADVIKGQPAAEAGLQKGDRIVAVGDSATPAYTELMPALRAYGGKPTELKVEREGKLIAVTATPTEDGKLGFQLTPFTEIYPVFVKKYTLFEAIPKGWTLGTSTLTNYVKSLSQIFSKRGAESIGGFGALGSMFPPKWDWYSFWNLTAFLSVALAFMNIIPIPALDGGHVMFLLYEVFVRRKPSEKFLVAAQYVGMTFLIMLMVWANLNDIIRFLL